MSVDVVPGRSPVTGTAIGVRVVNSLAVIGFALLLRASYRAVESEVFEYQGLLWNPPSGSVFTATIVALAILAALGPTDMRRPSALMYWMMLLTVTTPVLLFSFHGASLTDSAVIPLVIAMALSQLAALAGVGARPPERLRFAARNLATLEVALVAMLLFGIAIVMTRPGFSWQFDVVDAYARRLAARDAAPDGALSSYVLASLNAAVAPLAFVIFLQEKRWLGALLSVAALMSLFAFFGTKSAVLTPLFFVTFLYIGRGRVSSSPLVIVFVASVLVAVGWWRFETLLDISISESFTRRLIDAKGISTVQYWEAFRDTPMYFRDSGIWRLFGGVPAGGKSFVIGELYGFGAEENANANAWAAMFANIGYSGFAVVTLAFVGLMRALDALARVGRTNAVRAYAGFVVFIFGEVALETSVLNGGLLLGIFLLAWYVATDPTANDRRSLE